MYIQVHKKNDTKEDTGFWKKNSETHGSMNNDTVETYTSSAIKIIVL